MGEILLKNTAPLHNFLMTLKFLLKKGRGGAVAQRFKKWRTSRWRKLKKVARAQHWCI